ncbi:MAG: hypothetical protein WCB27_19120 [Thermoguttaceae bacterium]|jgi:hypothetical protein
MLATQCDTYDGNLRDLSLQMLRPLGGSIGVNYYRRDSLASGIQEIQTVFVSCPLRSWAAVFGEPQQVHLHFDLPTAQWECSWEQHLPNGLVRCVGYIFERSPGVNWIIVKQFNISRPAFAGVARGGCRRASVPHSRLSPHSRSLEGQS